jgi:hypothetical protein
MAASGLMNSRTILPNTTPRTRIPRTTNSNRMYGIINWAFSCKYGEEYQELNSIT